jgi:hypothetical protein
MCKDLFYDQFLIQGSLLTSKLMSQEFLKSRLQAQIRKFCGSYKDLVCQYGLSLEQLLGRSWHTATDYGLFRSPDLEIGLTAGVIS